MKPQTLYVADPNSELRSTGRWLILERDGATLARISPRAVDHVLLVGEVSVGPGAVAVLLKHKVPVTFLDGRGTMRGHLLPAEPPTPTLRQAQYQCADNEPFVLDMAQALIAAKLSAARQLLLRHRRNAGITTIEDHLDALADLRFQLPDAEDVDSLRGLEGAAAAIYFDAFSRLLQRPSGFRKRTRRPPRDPVNALLSFGYTLLHAEITGQVAAVGLDPQVGFMHAHRAGRPALALDLIEEFRVPVVDRVVLRCWNLGILGPDDFELTDKHGPRLKPHGRATFLREYERRMARPFHHVNGFWTTYRRLLHGQARAVAHCVRHREPYHHLCVRL